VDDHYCLSEVALFQDLSRREMADLSAAAPRRTVAVGQVVFDPTRPAEVLFIVKAGRFRLFRVVPDGRTVTTAVPGPGSVFGQMDLLGLRMGGTWAEALEAGDLCLMSRTDVQRLLLADRRISTRIAEQLGRRVLELEDRLTDLVSKSLVERTAHALCVMARPDKPSAEPEAVRLTHSQLAGLVGATRERTTTALGVLAESGLVNLRRGRIRIVDFARLAAVADGADVRRSRRAGNLQEGDRTPP
jgi:CRP-like cAMP-binding protein